MGLIPLLVLLLVVGLVLYLVESVVPLDGVVKRLIQVVLVVVVIVALLRWAALL